MADTQKEVRGTVLPVTHNTVLLPLLALSALRLCRKTITLFVITAGTGLIYRFRRQCYAVQ